MDSAVWPISAADLLFAPRYGTCAGSWTSTCAGQDAFGADDQNDRGKGSSIVLLRMAAAWTKEPAAGSSGRRLLRSRAPGQLRRLLALCAPASLAASTTYGGITWLERRFSTAVEAGHDQGSRWVPRANIPRSIAFACPPIADQPLHQPARRIHLCSRQRGSRRCRGKACNTLRHQGRAIRACRRPLFVRRHRHSFRNQGSRARPIGLDRPRRHRRRGPTSRRSVRSARRFSWAFGELP